MMGQTIVAAIQSGPAYLITTQKSDVKSKVWQTWTLPSKETS